MAAEKKSSDDLIDNKDDFIASPECSKIRENDEEQRGKDGKTEPESMEGWLVGLKKIFSAAKEEKKSVELVNDEDHVVNDAIFNEIIFYDAQNSKKGVLNEVKNANQVQLVNEEKNSTKSTEEWEAEIQIIKDQFEMKLQEEKLRYFLNYFPRMAKECEKLKEDSKILKDQFDESEKMLQQEKLRNVRLEEELGQKTKACDKLKEDMKNEVARRVRSENKIGQLEDTIKESETRERNISEEYNQAKGDLISTIGRKNDMIYYLELELHESKRQERNSEKQYSQLVKSYRDKISCTRESAEENWELRQRIGELSETIEQLRAANEELEIRKENLSQKYKNLKGKRKEQENEICPACFENALRPPPSFPRYPW